MRTIVGATVLLAAVGLAACGDGGSSAATPTGAVVVDGVTVFVAGHESAGEAPEALLSGTVTVIDGCLVVAESDGEDGAVPLFPQGTRVKPGADGPVVETSVGGLTVGDEVGLGGGFIGGLGGDLGDCDGVVRSGGFSVFSVERDPDV